MTKKIKCQLLCEQKNKQIRVRILRAPLVNSEDLKNVISARAEAIVL